jgi:uncharacterized membrane protein YebE (DUF533 family)
MTDFQSLKESILADGIIDSDEVEKIRSIIFEDGKIDTDEANFLFELNDAVSGKANAPAWENLMVDAITKYLLEDEKSPGEVDEEEGKWLVSKIEGDGKIDEIEKLILLNIKNKSKTIPNSLIPLMNKI